MSLDTFPPYEVAATALPARSRLYPLAPIGVGTPLVESLTSYLTRLAHAHGVTVETLAAAEIAPLVDKSAAAARVKFSIDSYHLNGLEGWTNLTLAALATLTGRDDLAFLTMQPWGQVLSRQNLLRCQLAWCPACYTHWQQTGQTLYIPLLWTLKPEALCPQHQQPLCDHCPYPDCARPLRLINSRIKLGYCPYCRRWLGLAAEASQENHVLPGEVERSWRGWLTDQLAGLLAVTSTLVTTPTRQLFARNFKRCVAASAPGSVRGLAQEMGIPFSSFFGWIRCRHPPQLGLLAQVCHHLDVSMLAMLTVQPGQDDDPFPPEAESGPPAKITVAFDILRRRLEGVLDDPQTSPGSAAQVARQLGVTAAIIKFHCPDQYQQIRQRYEQDQAAYRQTRNQKLAGELQAILDKAETPPPSLLEVARRLQINPQTARANCPELCRRLCHQRKLFYETRDAQAEAGLREILAVAEDPPPSMNQVAARLNEKVEYLSRKFPKLCQAVTQRYRSYQPPPARSCPPEPASPKPKSKNQVQLRRQFTMLITDEEDPPLSLAEISRQLGCGIALLRKRHGDLCRQLRQRWDAYRQQRQSRVEAQLRHLMAAVEGPMPPVREVARQLGVDVTTLKQWLPELYAEVVRRHQAGRQAERQRRQAYLDQIVSENPASSPSLSQVADCLGCGSSILQRRFPRQSRIIVDRYRAYREQEYVTAQAALEAALSDSQHPPLLPLQVARQLGYENKRYLQAYFPDLCHQLFQRYEAHRQQVARAQLAAVLAEPVAEPASLPSISRQLGYHLGSLQHLCPDLCQRITERYQAHWQQKKQVAQEVLEAILAGAQAPASVTVVARQCGYSLTMLQHCLPELTQAVSARYKVYLQERGEQRRRQLDAEIQQITRTLFEQGIDPKLHRVISRLVSPGAAKASHVRQAWQAARQELGLPT